MTQEALLVHLKLDSEVEGRVADSSGHGRRGVLSGGAAVVADDVFGACLEVDGTGEVRVPDDPDLRLAKDLTVEAWVLVSHPLVGETHFVAKGQGDARNYVLAYLADKSWMFQWSHYADGSISRRIAQNPPIRLNDWYHVTGVRDSQQVRFYVHDLEGGLLATGATPLGPAPSTVASPLLIGLGHRGRVAHVRVYAAALYAPDVISDMASDLAVYRRRAELPGLATPQAALRFPADETRPPQVLHTRVDLDPPNLRNGFALEAFIKTYDTGPSGIWPRRVVAAFNPPGGWVLSLDRGVLTFQITVLETAPGSATTAAVVKTLRESDESAAGWSAADYGWNHVAVSIHPSSGSEPARYVLYRNGLRVDIVVSGTNPVSAASGGPLWVGAVPDAGPAQLAGRFFGEISELRIWDRPLSARSIAVHRRKRLSGNEFALLGYWPIDQARDGVFRNQVMDIRHLRPVSAVEIVAPDSPDQTRGPRLKLLAPEIVVDPALETQRFTEEALYWRRETQRAAEDRVRLDRDRASQQTTREQLEEAVAEAEAAAGAEADRGETERTDLEEKLAEDLRLLDAKLEGRSWDFDEIIGAVDGQLREARAAVAPDATHRLDSLSLNMKVLPSQDGARLNLPDPQHLDSVPPEALSNVRFDFESREKFEATKPRKVTVPDVRGMTEVLARRTLAASGLIMQIAYAALPLDPARSGQASETERQVGTVREQLPVQGSEISQHERVIVYIGLRAPLA